MANIIFLCDLHLDNLIHIDIATRTRAVMKALCGLLLMFFHVFFSKTPNLASMGIEHKCLCAAHAITSEVYSLI